MGHTFEHKRDAENQKNGITKVYDDKRRLIKSLPLANVFNHVSKHKKCEKAAAVDDTCIKVKAEEVTVELTGHDFTGLGFNICGNMRDGIFIKDVMNRGPANESGKVKAGDRISSVTISFKNMVYEDALTILSYASPYNVQLTLEKNEAKEIASSSCGLFKKTYLSNNSHIGSGRRLLHPLYRSQSLEDLTQIVHSSSEKSSSCGGKSPQSVIQKLKSELINRSEKKMFLDKEKTSHRNSSTASTVPAHSIVVPKDASSPKANQSRISTEVVIEDSTTLPVANAAVELRDQKFSENADFIVDVEEAEKEIVTKIEPEKDDQGSFRPQPAPRKPIASAKKKGRAPQPPSLSIPTTPDNVSPGNMDSQDVTDGSSCKLQLETTAQVHQEDETGSLNIIQKDDDSHNNESKSAVLQPCEKEPLNGLDSSTKEDEKKTMTEPPSRIANNEKLKSSSLGDLTRMNSASLNAVQSVLLERAVSLDFKDQHLPEENLCLHYKNIRVPSDVDYKNSENIAFTNWGLKNVNRNTSSILTTSSSDCVGSNAIIFMNGHMSITDDNEIITEVNKGGFVTSTPVKQKSSQENVDECNNIEETAEEPVNVDECINIEETVEEPVKLEKHEEFFDDTLKADTKENCNVINISSFENSQELKEKSEDTDTGNETFAMNKDSKGVIEISARELDFFMMSYKDYTEFLEKETVKMNKINSISPVSSVPVHTSCGIANVTANQLDFESWSYISDQEASISHDSTLYKTALESEDFSTEKHIPEVSGVTLKTS